MDVWAGPWADPAARQAIVARLTSGGRVCSDRPAPGEGELPLELYQAKRRLLPAELARYRQLGRDSAEALTDLLEAASPDWTENQLAGSAAAALWARGIAPALTLVAGARRLPLYRHPTPTAEVLGERAMLVVCGRRHGLYANLTRFVSFRQPSDAEHQAMADVAAVEAAAWAASGPGQTLGAVYEAIAAAYVASGHPGAERDHHQGGTTGYLSREIIARPGDPTSIEDATALAWNPSLVGVKIEDTAVTSRGGIEVLTVDPRWPTLRMAGRDRPTILVRS
jgi:Xaa-Pro aminopeptidase